MPLDAWIRRYFGVIVALLLALAAYFQAGGLSQLVAAMLVVGEDDPSAAQLPTVRTAGAATPAAVQRRQHSADPILSRNPFDSVTGPLDGRQTPIELPKETADLSSPLTAPDCDGITAVIVTESRDPTWSIAALKGGGEDKPSMKRVGDKVGDREVAFIGYNPVQQSPSVWLISQSQLCQALMFKRAGAAPAPASAAAAPAAAEPAAEPAAEAPRGGAAKIPPEMASKIQKVSENEYTLERSLVDEIMENQGTLMRSARIVPEQKNGETLGIRLFGIRPDTLLGTLGLQNGDRLEEINGFKMGSPEQALEAYARLRTAASLTIKVNRRGKAMNLDYQFK
jgi:general secretion pathway protein C